MIATQDHQAFVDHPDLAEAILKRAEILDQRGIFLGCPLYPNDRYLNGYKSLLVLKHARLQPYHSVLEIGCGSLRSGYWIIDYLDNDKYYGTEPNNIMLTAGIIDILTDDERMKVPRFSRDEYFNFTEFKATFDYVLACSIWSHAAKWQIEKMLDQFLKHASPYGKFLASYIPARTEEEDYWGDEWVGKSHKSNVKATVCHGTKWITDTCNKRGLTAEEMPSEFSFGNQNWLCIKKGR